MDFNRQGSAGQQVDVTTLLQSISRQLEQNQGRLDSVDRTRSDGTHGERMAEAFRAAVEAAQRAERRDAGEQFALAAEAMRQQGRGKAVGFYADGLEEASQQFRGQSGVSIKDLLPLLQSFVGGVQKNNPARPGEGTMIDALLPAVTGYRNAQQRGQDNSQAALEALLSAVQGAKSTAHKAPRTRGGAGYAEQGDYVDPGAASATNVLGGIVTALLPGVLSAISQRGTQAQQPRHSPDDEEQGGSAGGLGDLIGALGQGFLASQQSGRSREQANETWWPF